MEGKKMKAKELRKASWNALKGNYATALLAALVAWIFGAISIGGGSTGLTNKFGKDTDVSGIIPDIANIPDWVSIAIIVALIVILIISVVMVILSSSVNLGYNMYNIKLINKENPETGVVFSRMKHIWKAFGLDVVIVVKIFLWSLLLIVPGIIAVYRYSMANFVMAENPEISIGEAINKSKEIMKGEKWRLFCMQISFFWWYLLAAIVPVIGFFLLTPYVTAADAAFYLNRTGRLDN